MTTFNTMPPLTPEGILWLRQMEPAAQDLARRFPPASTVQARVEIGRRLAPHRRMRAGALARVVSYQGPAGQQFPTGVVWAATSDDVPIDDEQYLTPCRPEDLDLVACHHGIDTLAVNKALGDEPGPILIVGG